MKLTYTISTAASLATASIRAHKLRSFLTLLGVIIGVSSVVIVGAAIEGLGNYAEETTAKAFGSDSFQIGQLLQVGRMTRRERIERLKYNHQIRPEDYTYLKQATGQQVLYSPYRRRAEDIRHQGLLMESVSIVGAAAHLAEIRDVSLTDGRFFTEQEEQNKVQVAVIGEDVRVTFFPDQSPIGKTLKVSGWEFRIIGVQEKIGSAGGDSQDKVIFIPATVFTRIYGPERSMVLFARARSESGLTLDEALDVTRVALRNRFKARPGKPDNFDSITPDSIREFIGRIMGLIGAAVVPITCISLVVGGIVIMNIMLVSVTERTREIGIRKSLGARQQDLLLQFLMEAVFLSAIGGAVGLAIGATVAKIATLISGVHLSVTLPYVFLALGVSSAVGVISGWYPARRAARMDPVEALRAE
jgi:putative ABC transport system permease protein